MRFRNIHTTSYIPIIVVIGILCVLNLGALVLYANVRILSYRPLIYAADTLPAVETVLVFGGGMHADGTQTIMQMDRVATGVKLYKDGYTKSIMMTGDDGGNRYDEVSAMKEQALRYEVPREVISADPHGYRTYESCWRAKYIYELNEIIVVSQNFHLPRILYICNMLGVDAVGYSANLRGYGSWWAPGPREVLARLKAWWQVEITKPKARIPY